MRRSLSLLLFMPRFAILNLKEDVCLSYVCHLLVIMRKFLFSKDEMFFKSYPLSVENVGLYAILLFIEICIEGSCVVSCFFFYCNCLDWHSVVLWFLNKIRM